MAKNGDGNCTLGRVMKKTETCNNHCFNDYTTSEKIGKFSLFNCGNTCVPAWKMGRGYSMCEDKSDVKACNETLKCVLWRGGKNTYRQQMVTTLSNNHSYCNYGDFKNDGKYDTITRMDETYLDIGRQKLRIDISSSVTPCPYYNIQGFMCGKLCVGNYRWCRGDMNLASSCEIPGATFTTNNRALCGNPTVWINKTCELFYSGSPKKKASLGRRCAGEVQRCYYPWYISSNFNYEVK